MGGYVGNTLGTSQVTVTANDSTDETVYPIFVDGTTGTQGAESDSGLTYNPSTGLLTLTSIVVADAANIGSASDTDAIAIASDGKVTFTQEIIAPSLDISGGVDVDGTLEADAYTVDGTTLDEYIADTIGAMVGSNTETGIAVTYEDSDNTLDFVIGTLNQDTSGTADNFTVTANNSTDETVYPIFVDGSTGSQGAESDTGLYYNPSTGIFTSTAFVGAIDGALGGSTPAAASVTTLAVSGAISGTSFKDEDDLSSNSATAVASQQSIKAYADAISYDDTDLRADIMTLALKEAITENRIAYNLPNSMIEQFQDDSKLGTETDGDRHANEYWGTVEPIVTTTLDLGTDFTVISSYEGGSSAMEKSTVDGSGNTVTTDNQNNGNFNFGVSAGTGLTGEVGDVYTWTQTLKQLGGGGGHYFPVGVSINKETEAYHHTATGALGDGTTLDQARCNHTNLFGSTSDVDDVLVTTITLGTLTGSGITMSTTYNGANATTATFVNGPNFDTATLEENGLFFFHTAYRDSAPSWQVHYAVTRARGGGSATGTLISTAQTANSSQTKVSGVILYKNEDGTATLGTDLKIYFTCDGGTNWTESTPTAAGTFSSGILMAKCPEVTCTSGTDIRYKAVWANQSAGSKETQLHGVGMNY